MNLVGVVGVGAMGSALMERLILAGAPVLTCDLDPGAREAARAAGAEVAGSPAQVAGAARVVDVVVRTDEEVLWAALGPEGILEGAPPDTLVLLHSTIHPRTTLKIAEAARPRGVHVIDACMVGVPSVARAGQELFLVGGADELFQRARPHLLRMGKEALHMGPLGAGNAAKLIKNLVTGSQSLIVHEALLIGEAAGIPFARALDMMRASPTSSLFERWEQSFDPSGPDPTPKVGANIFGKDLPLAAQLGRDFGLDLPITTELVRKAAALMEAAATA